MSRSKTDGTYTCSKSGCNCRVADDANHPRNTAGEIFCSDSCRDGKPCGHSGCGCGAAE